MLVTSVDIVTIKSAISWMTRGHVPDWLRLTNIGLATFALYCIYMEIFFVVGLMPNRRKRNTVSSGGFVLYVVLVGRSILGVLLVRVALALDVKDMNRYDAPATETRDGEFPGRSPEELEKQVAVYWQHDRDQLMYDGFSLAGFVMIGGASLSFGRTR